MNLFSKKTNQSEEEIILHAHKKAQAIIKEAVDSAQQLLTQTQLLTDSLKEQTALGMKSAVEAQTKRLDAEMKAGIEKVLAEFNTNVQKQLTDSSKLLETKTADEFIKVQAELAEYKKAKELAMEALVSKKVTEIAQDVLGKTIDAKTHESLVIEAIEKAGKGGFFR